MRLGQVTDEREPEAEATVAARGARVGLPEAFKDIRQKIAGDALPVVLHRQLHRSAGARQAHGDHPAFRGELDRVVDEVPEDLLQPIRVSFDARRRGIQRNVESDALRVGRRANRLDRRLHHRHQVDRAELEPQLARNDPRAIEDVFDELHLHFRISLDDLEPPRESAAVDDPGSQHLGPAENRVEGSPKLVRCGRQKLVLCAARELCVLASALCDPQETLSLVERSLHGFARPDRVGHVERHDQDSRDLSLEIAERLVDERDDGLVADPTAVPIEMKGHLAAHEPLTRRMDAVERLEKALAGELRQRLSNGQPEDSATRADELHVRRIRQRKRVRGTAQNANRRRRLHEERVQLGARRLCLAMRSQLLGQEVNALRLDAPLFSRITKDENDPGESAIAASDGRRAVLDRDLRSVAPAKDSMIRQTDDGALAQHLRDGTFDGDPRLLVEEWEDAAQRLTRGFGLGPPGQSAGDRVQERDLPLRVGRDHSIADARERRRQPICAETDLLFPR